MPHWVYVLECDEDRIYVGETTHLFTRFNQHINGGSVNTSKWAPRFLVGLYKVADNTRFAEYHNAVTVNKEYNKFIIDRWSSGHDVIDPLLIENRITERFLYERSKTHDYNYLDNFCVHGGKYTKDDAGIDLKIKRFNLENLLDRPLCKCNVPAEVKLSKDTHTIYFVCALKNVWPDFYDCLDVADPCDFYQAYTNDNQVKERWTVLKKRSWEDWICNIPLSRYKINAEPCISCNITNEYVGIYNRGVRRLCQNCLFSKYDELKTRYTKTGCLIED